MLWISIGARFLSVGSSRRAGTIMLPVGSRTDFCNKVNKKIFKKKQYLSIFFINKFLINNLNKLLIGLFLIGGMSNTYCQMDIYELSWHLGP
jgi:hypothetical protein